MSSYSGNTSAIPSAPPKAGNLDAQRLSTNQQAVVYRYLAGMRKMPLTWLDEALNQHTRAVTTAGGGKGTPSTANGHDYYADVLGLACLGPVDAITEIWMDDDLAWSGNVTRASGADSATVNVPKKGNLTIFWGTETQTMPSYLVARGHPGYRGQCVLYFQQLYFGRDKTNAPNIEVTLKRQPQVSGLATPSDVKDDTNPAHPMAELLTNPRFGARWDGPNALDLAEWDASAARLRDEGVGISPLIDRDQTMRTLLVQFCEYFDGYLAVSASGKLALRLARPQSADPSTLPLLGEFDLLDLPNPQSMAWRSTANEVNVTFTDRAQKFQSDSEPWRDLANLRMLGGEPRPLNLERPWITRRAQAQQTAAYAGRLNSVVWVSGKISVRKDAAVGLAEGSFIRLTYADYPTTLIMRVTSRKVTTKRTQTVELGLRSDGYYNDLLPYTPARPPLPDAEVISPLAPLAQRIVELPAPLVPGGSGAREHPHLAALVARASAMDVRARVYSSEDEIAYDEAVVTDRFAVAGTLAADYPLTPVLDNGADGMLITLPGPDTATAMVQTTQRGLERMRLLVFVGDEILSYRDATMVSGGVRLNGLRRACYDTARSAHPAFTPVLIIRRRDLAAFTASTYAQNDTVHFKVATSTAAATLDLSEVDPANVTLVNRTARPLAPINLRVNGSAASPTYSAGGSLLVEWDAASWARHEFWASWEQAYSDDKLHHRVRLCTDAGDGLIGFRCGSGVSSYAITNAQLLSAFGGSEPSALLIQVFSRRRGHRSITALELRVTKS